jgi:hypothetical protein
MTLPFFLLFLQRYMDTHELISSFLAPYVYTDRHSEDP